MSVAEREEERRSRPSIVGLERGMVVVVVSESERRREESDMRENDSDAGNGVVALLMQGTRGHDATLIFLRNSRKDVTTH